MTLFSPTPERSARYTRKRPAIYFAFLLTFGSASACVAQVAVQPTPVPRNLPGPATITNSSAGPNAATGAATGVPGSSAAGTSAAVPVSGPLSLDAAVSTAVTANTAARTALLALNQAQARLNQAQAQSRVTISFNSTFGLSNAKVIQPPPPDETFTTFANTVTATLPNRGRSSLAVGQAMDQVRVAKLQYLSARRGLAGQVIAAYYDLLRKRAISDATRVSLGEANRALTEATKRNALGDVPQLDVLRAQVPVAQAQAAELQARNAVVGAEQTLNSVLGLPLGTPVNATHVVGPLHASSLSTEQIIALAVERSPDVQAAAATVDADDKALRLARRYRDPSFSVQAGDTRSNDQTGFSRLDNVQASVTFPISDGGLGAGQVKEAQSVLAQAQVQLEGAKRLAQSGAAAADLAVRNAASQTVAAKVALDISQAAYEKTIAGYHEKLYPLSDTLVAQSAYLQSLIAYTQSLYDQAAAISTVDNLISDITTKDLPQ